MLTLLNELEALFRGKPVTVWVPAVLCRLGLTDMLPVARQLAEERKGYKEPEYAMLQIIYYRLRKVQSL